MLVKWRPQALEEIAAYFAERNPRAAEQLQAAIETAAEALLYRPGRVPGTREVVVHPNYLIVYSVGTERISIVDVLHARQEYP